jgi:Mg-chelatase subunit ChlD
MTFLKLSLMFLVLSMATFASSTILVLDASGSMDDTLDGSGAMTKIEVAKQAATTFLDSVKPGDEVALIVYYDCSDIRTEVPFTTSLGQIRTVIAGVEPNSNTPLAASIVYASDYAKNSGRTNADIIILTDGEETCDTQEDAIAAAQAAVAGPIRIINVVGFAIADNSGGTSDLEALAAAGKGKYYAAADANQLAASLTQAYQGSSAGSCCVPFFALGAIACAAALHGRK